MKNKPKRYHEILFRLSDKELEILLEQVQASGLSREEYLRSLISGTSVCGYSDEFTQKLNKTITKRGDGYWQ